MLDRPKTKMVSYSAMRSTSLANGERAVFQRSFKPRHCIISPDTHEARLWNENTITATEVLLAGKS